MFRSKILQCIETLNLIRMKHPKPFMSEKKNNFISGELLICLLICIVGLLMLSRVMTSCPDHSPTVYTPPNTNSSPKTARLGFAKFPKLDHVEDMDIKGFKEAKEKLTFYIPDFHRKIKYDLDLGNGKVITVKEEKVTYAYPEYGTYNVKLWGSCNGQRKLLRTKRLRIKEAIEVSEDAFKEVD